MYQTTQATSLTEVVSRNEANTAQTAELLQKLQDEVEVQRIVYAVLGMQKLDLSNNDDIQTLIEAVNSGGLEDLEKALETLMALPEDVLFNSPSGRLSKKDVELLFETTLKDDVPRIREAMAQKLDEANVSTRVAYDMMDALKHIVLNNSDEQQNAVAQTISDMIGQNKGIVSTTLAILKNLFSQPENVSEKVRTALAQALLFLDTSVDNEDDGMNVQNARNAQNANDKASTPPMDPPDTSTGEFNIFDILRVLHALYNKLKEFFREWRTAVSTQIQTKLLDVADTTREKGEEAANWAWVSGGIMAGAGIVTFSAGGYSFARASGPASAVSKLEGQIKAADKGIREAPGVMTRDLQKANKVLDEAKDNLNLATTDAKNFFSDVGKKGLSFKEYSQGKGNIVMENVNNAKEAVKNAEAGVKQATEALAKGDRTKVFEGLKKQAQNRLADTAEERDKLDRHLGLVSATVGPQGGFGTTGQGAAEITRGQGTMATSNLEAEVSKEQAEAEELRRTYDTTQEAAQGAEDKARGMQSTFEAIERDRRGAMDTVIR